MITSTSNAKVKRLVSLKKKRKARDEEKVFLVEGIRMFREMPLEILREVYVSETFYRKEGKTAEQVLAGGRIVPQGSVRISSCWRICRTRGIWGRSFGRLRAPV